MSGPDEALRRLQETFRREREERELEVEREPIIGTATKPRSRRSRPSRRAFGWLIALVVLAAIATPLAIVGASYVQRFRVAYTVNTFCADLADQSYNAAYGLLSQRARQTMSERQLEDDVRSGHLTSCTISQGTTMYGNIVISGNLATVTVTYVYSDASGATAAGDVMALVNENGGWRVDSFDWVNPFPALIQ